MLSGFSNGNMNSVDWSRNSTAALSQAASTNSTYLVIDEFRFLAAKSIRTSTIILASFNTISAAATAAGILYDCYSSAKRNRARGNEKINLFTCVHGPETFPFILSIGIVIQGIIFAVSQSQGLDGLFESGCSLMSQLMWPAVFIVPYLQLIFGLEASMRALRTRPIPTRSKWTVAICLALFVCLLVITGLVAFFIRAPDFCFASLFWFVARWAEGGFVLLLVNAVVLILCAVTIFVRLTRNANMETTERVIASRMVYYLALAIISTVLVIPFFGWLTFNDMRDSGSATALTLSMIATVVANVSGLLTGGLHLFLRSNTIATIGPRDKLAEYERQRLKHKIRMQGPEGSDHPGHVLQPVNGRSLRKTGNEESLVRFEKDEEAELESPVSRCTPQFPSNDLKPLRSNAGFDSVTIPRAPEPAQLPTPSSPGVHSRKTSTSYSLFPSRNAASTTSVALLSSTTYSPNPNNNEVLFDLDDLKPPPNIKSSRHKRDSSMASSATVQIGLRFSNMEDVPRMTSAMVPNEQVHTLGCPKESTPWGSVLAVLTNVNGSTSPTFSTESSSTVSPKDTRMKTLPRLPHPPAPVENSRPDVEETLSPAVYSPSNPIKVKLPSPKGVGFNVMKRANTNTGHKSRTWISPQNRNNSDAAVGRGDWI